VFVDPARCQSGFDCGSEWYLEPPNGYLVGLRSKLLHPRQLGIAFDPVAACPLFESFLETIFEADKDLISYVQGILGYGLTPEVTRQELYFFHGSGANGKSTLLNTIRRVFGKYSSSMMKESLFDKSTNNTLADIASMRGIRMAVVQEAESDLRLNTPRVKEMTGGDILRVAPKYKSPFDLVPEFKIIVLCNRRPALDAYDDALKRRIEFIPFDHVVSVKDRDSNLEVKLKKSFRHS
jgi:putative DNA primase/helicase